MANGVFFDSVAEIQEKLHVIEDNTMFTEAKTDFNILEKSIERVERTM